MDATDDSDEIEQALFAPFAPNADGLLRRISLYVEDATLHYIAGLDAGMAVEEYLRALCQIRDRGILPYPFGHCPQEVLNALLYKTGPEESPRRGERPSPLSREQAHWARAFAGATLIRAFGDDDMSQIVGGCTLQVIQMLESLRCLNAGLEREAMAAMAWLILRRQRFGDESDCAFTGVGMLALAARRQEIVEDGALLALAEWVIAEEQRAFDDVGKSGRKQFAKHWLLRTDPSLYFAMLSSHKWIALGVELAGFDGEGRSREAVRDIGARLAGRR